ncbi:hypothetical protein PR048_032454 [Dryococelus australis]|uniref:Receptor ligand binding region domain-containing protein n=1 Tax=Dryococelus australis TaxID=614101 RepID=A0ABQ9G6C3_9NEOP|nr:hypothetical protein PR048_032454 [Dryococelus australis]
MGCESAVACLKDQSLNSPERASQSSLQLQLAPSLEHQTAAMLSILERYKWHQFSVVTSQIAGHDDFIQAVGEQILRANRVRFPDGVALGLLHVGIVTDDAAGRRVFLGDIPFPPPSRTGAASFSPHFTHVGSRGLDRFDSESVKKPRRLCTMVKTAVRVPERPLVILLLDCFNLTVQVCSELEKHLTCNVSCRRMTVIESIVVSNISDLAVLTSSEARIMLLYSTRDEARTILREANRLDITGELRFSAFRIYTLERPWDRKKSDQFYVLIPLLIQRSISVLDDVVRAVLPVPQPVKVCRNPGLGSPTCSFKFCQRRACHTRDVNTQLMIYYRRPWHVFRLCRMIIDRPFHWLLLRFRRVGVVVPFSSGYGAPALNLLLDLCDDATGSEKLVYAVHGKLCTGSWRLAGISFFKHRRVICFPGLRYLSPDPLFIPGPTSQGDASGFINEASEELQQPRVPTYQSTTGQRLQNRNLFLQPRGRFSSRMGWFTHRCGKEDEAGPFQSNRPLTFVG